MASQRAFTTLPSIARLARPITKPATTTRFMNHVAQRPTITQSASILQLQHTKSSLRTSIRFAHTIPRPSGTTPAVAASSTQPGSESEPTQAAEATPRTLRPSRPLNKQEEPHYEMTFTCVPCGERSAHNVTKQGYHHGSVLITCPGCRVRHVISDHLKIFGDRKLTVEDILRERGQLVKKGTLSEEDDLEFWEDGTATVRPEAPEYVEQEVEPDTSAPGSSFVSVRPPAAGGDKKEGQ
ncbi:DNL zinc finger-domain-containing protein [Bombardia bombarda]|uniref:DNL zinc finger-domain-containing protein n=1 Tax=Bombardia bombarda TaxID=252184 RepID=A0AA39WZZ6_9PEZI|nr:DNL zinc finger-domain-containing protein [Bombardia bombarda]